MKPALSSSGLALAGGGAAFVLVGTLLASWPLVAFGLLQISTLLVLYVLFVPHAVMFRRRQLEFAWWVPSSEIPGGALSADKPVKLQMLFRNHSPLSIALAELTLLRSACIDLENEPLTVAIPRQREVRLEVEIVPRAAGHWFLQGLTMRIGDRFGLFVMHAYFPNALGLKVFPRLGLGAPLAFRPQTGAAHERAGPRLLRQRGLGSDLRELREHTAGDPFKRIAWKATARTGKLMVREYESEIVVTHQLLLDISPTMRRFGIPGQQKLDTGLSLCAGLARVALDGGDRVGLISFDTRIYGQLKPADGTPQLFRILEHLLELHNIVDDDLTDMTDGELCSAVADYLAYQEGVDVRLAAAPERGSAHWDALVVGSHSELIDLPLMVKAVVASLERGRKRQPARTPQVQADDQQLERLRRFCRLRGIELPYRRESPVAGKVDGMVEALNISAASRASRFIVLVSDLLEIENPDAVLETLRLARRRRHQIVVVIPAPSPVDPQTSPDEQRVRHIIGLREQREQRALRRQLEALGARVLVAASPRHVGHLIRAIGGGRLPRPARTSAA